MGSGSLVLGYLGEFEIWDWGLGTCLGDFGTWFGSNFEFCFLGGFCLLDFEVWSWGLGTCLGHWGLWC